uniref:Midkine n=1 Tax=Oncorhynchus tshawytscha TaxID=74940 RepID=A0A8C8JGK1_ONCTS
MAKQFYFVSSTQRTFPQKVQSLSPCAVANCSLAFLWQKPKRGQAECPEKCFVKCVPNAGDFGDGFCEATCSKHTTKQCNIPCNWKKAFGADCKYRFTNWGECDTNTGTKSRSGTLKKDLFKLELPCSSRPKGKGGKGRTKEGS